MRKWLAAVMAMVMMMLAVIPGAALAKEVYSPNELMEEAEEAGLALASWVSFVPGDLPFGEEINTPVSDLLKALKIYTMNDAKNDHGAFALWLDEMTALQMEWEEGKDDRDYFSCSWIGNKVLSFNDEEVAAFVEKLMNVAAQATGMNVSELTGGMSMRNEIDFDEEDLKPLLDYIAELAKRLEIKAVAVQPENCDAAVRVGSLTLTVEDIAQYYEAIAKMLLSNEELVSAMEIVGALDMQGESLTFAEMLRKIPEQIRENGDMISEIPVNVYLDEKDEPVCVTAECTVTNDDEKIRVTGELGRLTGAEGQVWTGELAVNRQDAPVAAVKVDILADNAKQDQANLSLMAYVEDGEPVEMLGIRYAADKQYAGADAADQATLTLSFRPEVDEDALSLTVKADTKAAFDGKAAQLDRIVDVYLTGEKAPLMSIVTNTTSIETPASLMANEIVKPGTLNDSDFQLFLNECLSNLSTAAMTALQALPTSVVMLFMGAME